MSVRVIPVVTHKFCACDCPYVFLYASKLTCCWYTNMKCNYSGKGNELLNKRKMSLLCVKFMHITRMIMITSFVETCEGVPG